jgi:hypothetical protein
MKNSILTTAAICLLLSCHKNDPATSATIEFEEPILNDTIAFMDSIHVEGTIIGNGKMNGFKIEYIDASTGTVLHNQNSTTTDKEYTFHDHWMNELIETTTIAVKITVDLDGNGNQTTAQRNVVCLPQ